MNSVISLEKNSPGFQATSTGNGRAAKSNILELVESDSKPDFADNSSTMLPEHCVLLAPASTSISTGVKTSRGQTATSEN